MTKEHYLKAIADIKIAKQKEIDELKKQYAMENNPHAIGDIVEDHICRIKIDKIAYRLCDDYPECVYYGVRLKKDNTPFLNGSHDAVYQSNIVRVIK